MATKSKSNTQFSTTTTARISHRSLSNFLTVAGLERTESNGSGLDVSKASRGRKA